MQVDPRWICCFITVEVKRRLCEEFTGCDKGIQ